MSSLRSVGEAAKVRLDGQIRAARATAGDHAPTLRAY
ncbi:MAG: hypothetical protein K0S65_4897, partial [Labilithrix sp.]|nr:hypothetical protein [Labilithrix sp.]